MEIDPAPAGQAVTDAAAENAILELTEVLEQLETTPENVPLIRRQISLMKGLQMFTEVLDATSRLASLTMLSEDTWLEYLDATIKAATSTGALSLDGFVGTLELFEQAEQDYISLAVLLRHIEFVLSCSSNQPGLSLTETETESEALTVDEEVSAFLTEDVVRDMLQGIVSRGSGFLSQSHLLWQKRIDWEMSRLKHGGQKENIHAVFAERLAEPHSTSEITSAAYSSFLSEFCPSEYEQRMVDVTSISQRAKFKWTSEKRFGKTREDLEQQLATGGLIQAYTTYVDWETDPRAKNPKTEKSPTADPTLIVSIFERAIAACSSKASDTQRSLDNLPKPVASQKAKGKGKGKAKAKEEESPENVETRRVGAETIKAYKDAETVFWEKYAVWTKGEGGDVTQLRRRSVRACPQSGALWKQLIVHQEMEDLDPEDIADTTDRALRLNLMTAAGDVSELFVGRIAYEIRRAPSTEIVQDGDIHPVLVIAAQAFEEIAKVDKAGDTTLRLEKMLLDWAETQAPQFLANALSLVSRPTKARSAAYQMVLLRAGIETREGDIDNARETLLTAIQRTDLDWPEAVYEALIQFENVHGTLDSLADAIKQIEAEKQKLVKRREKAAQEQYQQYYEQQALVAQQAQIAAATEPPQNIAAEAVVETGGDVVMASSENPAPVPVQEAPKAADDDNTVKRDREHTTVLVNGLPNGIDVPRIEAYFAECGRIRETTILSGDETSAALVEFRFADAVPEALSRDGRKFDGRLVHVSMLWRSNLFVTNFPRDMDDQGIRQLFSQYGRILQTRWPSRKYADSRRFCYITMESPSAAQECLILHGMQVEGLTLTVLISDPAVKAKRSDDNKTEVSKRTLFVGGLTQATTQADVEELVKPHGKVKNVNLGWNAIKSVCKGHAFVEMATEDEAKAALSLHGTKRKGRVLRVEISDPNFANKKQDPTTASGIRHVAEKRARAVRLLNIPADAQEGLLQQALEKIVPVRRVELFAHNGTAVVELEKEADVGMLLLRSEPFIFNDTTIVITDHTTKPVPASTSDKPNKVAAKPDAKPASALSFAPRAARRGGKVIGRESKVNKISERAKEDPKPDASTKAEGGQDFFRKFVLSKNEERQQPAPNPESDKTPKEDQQGTGDAVPVNGEGSESAKRKADAEVVQDTTPKRSKAE